MSETSTFSSEQKIMLFFVSVIIVGGFFIFVSTYEPKEKQQPQHGVVPEKIESATVIHQEDREKLSFKKDSLIKLGETKLNSFRKSTDDFSSSAFYYDKRSPVYVNQNFIYPYIGGNSGTYWLQFKLQYHSDSWLFINKYILNGDGENLITQSPEFKTDHASGKIWEYSDENLDTKYFQKKLYKLASSKKAQVRYIGRQYRDDRVLTAKEKSIIKNTLETFWLLKGIDINTLNL